MSAAPEKEPLILWLSGPPASIVPRETLSREAETGAFDVVVQRFQAGPRKRTPAEAAEKNRRARQVRAPAAQSGLPGGRDDRPIGDQQEALERETFEQGSERLRRSGLQKSGAPALFAEHGGPEPRLPGRPQRPRRDERGHTGERGGRCIKPHELGTQEDGGRWPLAAALREALEEGEPNGIETFGGAVSLFQAAGDRFEGASIELRSGFVGDFFDFRAPWSF
jgi:hypothetical protein